MKDKMLLKLERDRLQNKNQILNEKIERLEGSEKNEGEERAEQQKQNSKGAEESRKNKENPQSSKIPRDLPNPYKTEEIQPVLNRQI